MAALALAVDAVVQPEDAEDVLVDAAVEVLGDGVLEDVELVGDDRVERPSWSSSDVDRHGESPGSGRKKKVRGAGGRKPGRSARAGSATHLVVQLVRRAPHRDAGGAVGAQNHDRHTNLFRPQKASCRGREYRTGVNFDPLEGVEIDASSGRVRPPVAPVASARMRMSELFLRTLRDDPADAEVDSHRLLVRAGYIRRVAAGIYSWLPLGYRVLRKVEQIVREEMDRAGAQETAAPDHPAARAVAAQPGATRRTAR